MPDGGWERTSSRIVGVCTRVTQDCLSVDVGVVLPELSPVISARAAAVSMSLPAIAEVVYSAVFIGGLLLMQPLWPM